MSETRSRLADQSSKLRRAFDSFFAEEVHRDVVQTDDLLAFRVSSEPYALRLSQISGLFTDCKITRLPYSAPAVLGLVGFRGSIVPAYDLQVLLGRYPIQAPRWLAAASAAPIAFAFEAFEGLLRVPRGAILPYQADEQSQRLVRDFASAGGTARPIVHLPFALNAIRRLLTGASTREER